MLLPLPPLPLPSSLQPLQPPTTWTTTPDNCQHWFLLKILLIQFWYNWWPILLKGKSDVKSIGKYILRGYNLFEAILIFAMCFYTVTSISYHLLIFVSCECFPLITLSWFNFKVVVTDKITVRWVGISNRQWKSPFSQDWTIIKTTFNCIKHHQ